MVPDRRYGGYRRVILAAVGCLIAVLLYLKEGQSQQPLPDGICAPDPHGVAIGCGPLERSKEEHRAHAEEARAQREQASSNSPVLLDAAKPVEPAPAAEYNPPCAKGQDDRRSDLCAQWKAADSAAEAAFWSKVQAYLSAVGIVGLLYSLYLTRTATEAATAAVDQSRTASTAEQRPWLKVEARCASDLLWRDGAFTLTVGFAVTNIGRTSAQFVQVRATVVIDPFSSPAETRLASFCAKERETYKPSGLALFPAEPAITSKTIEPNDVDKRYIIDKARQLGIPIRVFPQVIGCVLYKEASNMAEIHQTQFIYKLVSKGKEQRDLFLDEDGDVPLADLFLLKTSHFVTID
jgi:hypothetical protein